MSEHQAHKNHIIPLAVYFKVLATLLFLTALTVAAAQVNFGEWNTVIAIAIASVKAAFVLLFFMHLKYDDKIFAVVFGCAIFFVILLWAISDLDIVTRINFQSVL